MSFAIADEIVDNDFLSTAKVLNTYIGEPFNQIILLLIMLYVQHTNFAFSIRDLKGLDQDICKARSEKPIDLKPTVVLFIGIHVLFCLLKTIFKKLDVLRVLEKTERIKMKWNDKVFAYKLLPVIYLAEAATFVVLFFYS